MSRHTDPYLDGLLRQDPDSIKAIYTDFAPRIRQMILQAGGTDDDARDVLQEALLVVWRKAQTPDFELTSGFYTYLFSVCRFTWLRKRRKKDNNTVTIEPALGLDNGEDIQHELETSERQRLFYRHLARMSEKCQRLLRLFFGGKSMRDIGAQLSIDTEHAVRNRKYRCQKKLEDSITSDPAYREHRSDT